MILRITMWIIMIFGGITGGYYLDNILFPNIHSDMPFHFISFLLGLITLILVLKISKNTGRTLGRYGRKGELKRMETNVLVKEGAYKHMRHPMHLGLMLFPLTFALLAGSPSFILIIVPIEIILMLFLIKTVEEKEAISKFGDEYIDYMNQVPGFCFKLKCLKELIKNISKE